MDVLVVGGGGREHALAWKCAQSPTVDRVFVAPGNAGTAIEAGVENVALSADDLQELLQFAQTKAIGLTIIGPEAPLVAGIVNTFKAHGLRCFGPDADAARLEGSKAFAKDFLNRHAIPTAAYGVFEDVDAAVAAIADFEVPVVIKADGLAAGKGVVIADTHEMACQTARSMLVDGLHAKAGNRIVVEEFLRGEEVSFICIVDGTDIVPLATSQDHKARDDGDLGPNTGGMGAYSPAPIVDDQIYSNIMREVIEPTVNGLQADGVHYTGFLYAGLMIDAAGQARVLEYNCRFGDPETQPILMRLRGDIVPALVAACDHGLASVELDWDGRASLGVVMAATGYPDSYASGKEIRGLDVVADEPECKIFHAGTRVADDGQHVVTSGGRVLCVTALGGNVTEAQSNAYQTLRRVNWEGAFYRNDIGYRAVAREQSNDN